MWVQRVYMYKYTGNKCVLHMSRDTCRARGQLGTNVLAYFQCKCTMSVEAGA